MSNLERLFKFVFGLLMVLLGLAVIAYAGYGYYTGSLRVISLGFLVALGLTPVLGGLWIHEALSPRRKRRDRRADAKDR